MKPKLIIALLATLVATFPLAAQITFGQPGRINGDWKFALNPGEDCSAVNYDDSGWRKLDLPHDWSVEFPMNKKYSSCTGYLPGGEGWYRKNLFVPASEKSRRLYLYYEGVGHGFYHQEGYYRQTLDTAIAFLRSLNYIE